MDQKIHTYISEKAFQKGLLKAVKSRIKKKHFEEGVFRMALSGGSAPGPLYKALAHCHDIDWMKVEIYLVDERYVPQDDELSNTRLIEMNLLNKLSSEVGKWITFDTSNSIESSLKKYEDNLDTEDKEFFDLVLLGMGSDGHTASLFPEDDLLNEKDRWVGHSMNGDPVPERLTLTYPALKSSKEIFFLIKGEQKKDILGQVEKSKAGNGSLPSAKLFHLDTTQVFFGEY
jgi:6-phosphogluconolactonase